jgi:hypothetical protein
MGAGEVLTGANTSVGVRDGDTVRRPTGHWTAAVHALLEHLRLVGFLDAPNVLGLDYQGREVLLFVAGEVGARGRGQRLAPWFATTEACAAIGDWLRRFHDAQQGFVPDPALRWRMVPGRPLTTGEVVAHHGVAPGSTIARPFGGLTVIDWDFCAPGDPIQDLAFSAWQWVPLWADAAAVAQRHGEAMTLVATGTRLAALADGYRASVQQRADLVDACIHQAGKHPDDLEAMAVTDPLFAALVELGVARNARSDAQWVAATQAAL